MCWKATAGWMCWKISAAPDRYSAAERRAARSRSGRAARIFRCALQLAVGQGGQALEHAPAVADIHSANNPIPDLALLHPQFARIDVALAQALTDSDATNTLLKPLIDSLHQEQIASIMPGVEGAGVMAVLWQLGVNFIQGNYLQAATAEMQYEFTDLT